MKQAAKATALVLAVSLLSGCSSSPEPADKPQAKTHCEIVQETATDKYLKYEAAKGSAPIVTQQAALIWFYYIVEESDCFNSSEVSTAKANIDLILNLSR